MTEKPNLGVAIAALAVGYAAGAAFALPFTKPAPVEFEVAVEPAG